MGSVLASSVLPRRARVAMLYLSFTGDDEDSGLKLSLVCFFGFRVALSGAALGAIAMESVMSRRPDPVPLQEPLRKVLRSLRPSPVESDLVQVVPEALGLVISDPFESS